MFTPTQEKWAMLLVLALMTLGMYVAAWVALTGPSGRDPDFDAGWIAAVSMAMCYQVGYRIVHQTLGPLVFVIAFLLPTTLQLVGVAMRLVRLYS